MPQDQIVETAAGYTVKAVCTRIADMDVAAAGNGERAAWKRYMSYALLAIARGVDKKALIEAIFGKGAKASKTFQNMYSMADKARNTVLGNHSWDEVRALPIDQATTMVIGMVNSHMATLLCTSKNDYDRFCNLSPAEAHAKRMADVEMTAEPVVPALPPTAPGLTPLIDLIRDRLDKSPLPDRMAAMELLARSVGDEPRRVFAENLLAEMANMAAAQSGRSLAAA